MVRALVPWGLAGLLAVAPSALVAQSGAREGTEEHFCSQKPQPRPTPPGEARPDDIVITNSTIVRNRERSAIAVACNGQKIVHFYMTRDSTRGWGRDRFLSMQWRPVDRRSYPVMDFNDGSRTCRYDVKLVVTDSRKVTREVIEQFDVCRYNILAILDPEHMP